jgi:hypothetical protein
MIPAFRAAGTFVTGATNVPNPTNLAPVSPAGAQNGDLLILVTSCRSITATVATPSGWTPVTGFPKRSATASGGSLYVFTRVHDGTASDDPTVAWTGVTTGTSGDSSTAGILAYYNVTATLDGTVQASDLSAQTTTSVIPAFTAAHGNALVIGMGIKLLELTGQTSTVATFTERADYQTVSGTGHVIEVSEHIQAGIGSSGTATITWSNTTSGRALTASLGLVAAPTAVTLTPAAESDAGQTLAHKRAATLPPAAESDAAQTARATHPRTLTPSAETDATVTLSITHLTGTHVTLTPALETDKAGGGAAPALPAIAGLYLWYKADAIVGLTDGDPVASWPDSSGNAFTATQTNAGKKPVYRTGQINGLPAVRFTAASRQQLASTADHSYGGLGVTVFAVVKIESAANPSAIVGANIDSGGNEGDARGGLAWGIGSDGRQFSENQAMNAVPAATNPEPAGWIVVAFDRTAAQAGTYHYWSGESANGSGTPGGYDLGAEPGRSSDIGSGNWYGNQFLDGYLAEFIGYEGVLSDADRGKVLNYLLARHGLGGTAGPWPTSKAVTIAPATSANAAQTVTATHPRALTTAAETDAAQALQGTRPPKTIVPAAETDAAQATTVTKPIHKTATVAAETDAAQTLGFTKPIHRTPGIALESDQAQPAKPVKPRTLTPGAESDLARATTFTKPIRKTPGIALETDAAQAGKAVKPRALTPGVEVDQAQLLARHKTRGITPAAETDAAQAAKAVKPRTLTPAAEADQAQTPTRAKRATLTPGLEHDEAQAATAGGAKTITPAAETDSARPATFTKPIHKLLAPSLEVDAAITLPRSKRRAITPALESDQARAITFTKPIHASLTIAAELDVAAAPGIRKRAHLLTALETDQAQPHTGGHARRLTAAVELDLALGLFRFGLAPDIDLPATLEITPAPAFLATRDTPTMLQVGAPTTTLAVKPYDTELATDGDQ